VSWADALRQDFVSFAPGSAGHVGTEAALQRAGLVLNPVMTFAQSVTALNMASTRNAASAQRALQEIATWCLATSTRSAIKPRAAAARPGRTRRIKRA
jgi:hypothetical protein